MIKNKDAYMKPFTFVVNNNMSKQVDRTFGDRVSSREVLEKNKIKYTIPYDGDLEWFINRYNIKGQLVEKIVKKSDGYYVQSEEGKNLGGPYKKKEDAEKRLDQVEYFKNKNKKIDEEDTSKQTTRNKKLKRDIVRLAKQNGFEGIVNTKELTVHHIDDSKNEDGLKDNSYKNLWFIKSKNWKDRELLHKVLHFMDRNNVSYDALLNRLEDIKLYQYDEATNGFKEKTLSVFKESLKESNQNQHNKRGMNEDMTNDYRWKASYGDGREIIFVSKSYDDAMQYAASNSKGWDFSVKREESMPTLSGDTIEIPETAEPIYTDMRMGVPMNFYEIDGAIYDNLGFRVSDEELKEFGLKEIFKRKKMKESLGDNYSNIPEVTEFNFVNKMHDKSGLLPGILPMRGFIRTLEQTAAKVGPVFKIRKSRFGKYISDADIKDERGDIEKDYGWRIYGDWDTSMSGYNEVWICKKLSSLGESLKEGAEGKREPGFEYVIYEQPSDDHSSYAPIVAIRSTRTEAAYLVSKLRNRSGFEKDYGYEKVPKGKFHRGDDFWGPFDADYNKLESLREGAKPSFPELKKVSSPICDYNTFSKFEKDVLNNAVTAIEYTIKDKLSDATRNNDKDKYHYLEDLLNEYTHLGIYSTEGDKLLYMPNLLKKYAGPRVKEILKKHGCSLDESLIEDIGGTVTKQDVQFLKDWVKGRKFGTYGIDEENGKAFIIFEASWTPESFEELVSSFSEGSISKALKDRGFNIEFSRGDYTYKTQGTFNPRSMVRYSGNDRTLRNRFRMDISWQPVTNESLTEDYYEDNDIDDFQIIDEIRKLVKRNPHTSKRAKLFLNKLDRLTANHGGDVQAALEEMDIALPELEDIKNSVR